MWYKVEVVTKVSKAVPNRLPPVEELQEAFEHYIERGQGIVNIHRDRYEYHYDLMLNDYHKVDSNEVIGHIGHTILEGDKLYLAIDFNDKFDPNKKYVCFYRAIIQSIPEKQDYLLHISNLFAVDLVVISEKDVLSGFRTSEITPTDIT